MKHPNILRRFNTGLPHEELWARLYTGAMVYIGWAVQNDTRRKLVQALDYLQWLDATFLLVTGHSNSWGMSPDGSGL